MPWFRILRALLVAYVAATAVHIGWIMAHEPFAFDAWNIAVDTGARPLSVGRFFATGGSSTRTRTRGSMQAVTYLAYKLDVVAEVLTPLAYLALSLAVTVLGLGAVAAARARARAVGDRDRVRLVRTAAARPQTMFCRAYSANYVYGAAIQLWFLVPLRLATTREASVRRALAYGAFGVIAGMCNEHTGPGAVAFLAGYGWWLRRRGERADAGVGRCRGRDRRLPRAVLRAGAGRALRGPRDQGQPADAPRPARHRRQLRHRARLPRVRGAAARAARDRPDLLDPAPGSRASAARPRSGSSRSRSSRPRRVGDDVRVTQARLAVLPRAVRAAARGLRRA